MSLSPLAAVFVQQKKATSSDVQHAAAAPAEQTQPGQRRSAPEASSSSAADDSQTLKMQTLSTIKRMLDNSILLDPWNQGIIRPAQGSNNPAGTGTADAPSQVQDAGQQSSGPVPAQHHLQQFMRGPPPGFGPPQHSSGMQQPAYAEVPFRADVPVSQPPAGYYPYASQAPPAPPVPQLQQLMQQPQQPQRMPSYNQRLPADGGQWQGQRPPSPLDSPQQAGFFAFSPAPPPLAMYPQQQQQGPPRPPYEPAPYPGFPCVSPGFDSPHAGAPPAGFSPMPVPPPAGGGYMPWHHPYGPPPQNENLGLFALQHLAHQRRQYRDPYYQAATNFWGAYCSTHNRFPAGAAAMPAAQPRTPPPPPRPPAPMQGYPMTMNAMKPRPPPAGYPAPQHAVAHGAGEPQYPTNLSGFGMVGRFAEYSKLGSRHHSGPQQGEASRKADSVRARRSSHAGSTGTDADHSVLIAALPRSSSVLLDTHMRSPLVSACNPPLRKSSSCDSFQRTGAEISHAPAGPGALLAVAGAAVVAAAAAAGDRKWHTDAGAASSSTFTPAMLLTHDGAKATYAAEPSRSTAGGRRSSSGGGSFASGRLSNRSLAWDPMSTLSSGGGAHPSAGGAAAAASASDGSDAGKPRAVAAKVPLVCAGSPYTPVTVMERNIWANSAGISNGGSSEFGTGLQLRPDQLEVMFRRLRADVRGPYARPL